MIHLRIGAGVGPVLLSRNLQHIRHPFWPGLMIKRKKLSSVGSLTHPNLVPRIEEFLNSRPTFKASAASIVDHLLSHYNDYQRLGSNKLTLVVNNCTLYVISCLIAPFALISSKTDETLPLDHQISIARLTSDLDSDFWHNKKEKRVL